MTYAQLVSLINTNLTRVGNNRVSASEIKEVSLALLDFAAAIDNTDAIPTWTAALIFQTDGTDAGKYCTHPDTDGKKRIWETKTDDNINQEPPTDPNITENTNWEEISASAGSSIQEHRPGLHGAGLVIVYHNHSVDGPGLYKLLEPVRPFNSGNIETEITDLKWEKIGGSGKGIAKTYASVAAMIADQAVQKLDFFYLVTEGWVIYQKLSTSTGAFTDYRKLIEDPNVVAVNMNFMVSSESFQFKAPYNLHFDTLLKQSGGTAVTIMRSDGVTAYVLGTQIDQFDYITVSVNAVGLVRLEGKKL